MKIVSPCPKCPYKLGLIQTFTNPCPLCELDDYKTFDVFNNMLKSKAVRLDEKYPHPQ